MSEAGGGSFVCVGAAVVHHGEAAGRAALRRAHLEACLHGCGHARARRMCARARDLRSEVLAGSSGARAHCGMACHASS